MFQSPQMVSYHVSDLEKAKQWHRTLLDREPFFDSPLAVVFTVGTSTLVLLLTARELESRYLTLPDGSPAGKVLDLFALAQVRVVG